MGIPSYFKRLTDSYKGILRRTKAGPVDWLLFDYNCLIYHVLRRPDCPKWSAEGQAAWQRDFLDEVARYTMKVVRQVEPTRGVYIAVDGVAPMAKIKQQRMRRFRAAVEASAAAAAAEPTWDKNAITPGTAFMDALAARLQTLAAKYARPDFRILLSATDEAGEGEQKLMSFLRAGGATGDAAVVIYGLDADLIVLSLWTRAAYFPERPMLLFREHVERGEIERDAAGEEVFDWFSIDELERAIRGVESAEYLQDYCAAMMLLGNDFLPTSMSFRLKEEGHKRLIELVAAGRAAAASGRLWSPETGLDLQGWQAIIGQLAAEEAGRFARAVQKKLQARSDDTNPEDEPLRTRADEVFLLNGRIVPHWRSIYNEIGFSSSVSARRNAARTYIQGMSWVVDYYTGKSISMEWVYMWHFAPLWSAVVAELKDGWIAPPAPGPRQLTPVEQLGMVLPLASWSLLPAGAAVRRLPEVAPEWFPETFHVQSIGKRFAWECEPEIPIPTPVQVWTRLCA